jgi:hypothetical protein
VPYYVAPKQNLDMKTKTVEFVACGAAALFHFQIIRDFVDFALP